MASSMLLWAIFFQMISPERSQKNLGLHAISWKTSQPPCILFTVFTRDILNWAAMYGQDVAWSIMYIDPSWRRTGSKDSTVLQRVQAYETEKILQRETRASEEVARYLPELWNTRWVDIWKVDTHGGERVSTGLMARYFFRSLTPS